MSPCNLMRKILMQRLQHGISALAIHLPDQLHVLIQESVAGHFISYILIKRRGVQIRGLLQQNQLTDDVFWGHNPGKTDSRCQCLRERAEVNHIAEGEAIVPPQILTVEHDQRSDVIALIPQLAIRIVLNDRNAVLVGKEDQLMPSSFRQRHTGRILEVRQDIHEFRPSPEARIEVFSEEPIVIDWHRNVLRTVDIKCLECAQISWSLDQNSVSSIDKQLADQIKSLLR